MPLSTWADQPNVKEEMKSHMDYKKSEQVEKKFVIGLAIVTSNEEGRFQKEVPALWDRFFRENLMEKIKNRTDHNLLAVYTDYQGDYTKPFTYLIGCEVSSLENIPEGFVGKEISSSSFAVFSANGQFPQSVQKTWQKIWNSDIHRSYKTDFEVYPADFNPQNTPEVKIYISIDS